MRVTQLKIHRALALALTLVVALTGAGRARAAEFNAVRGDRASDWPGQTRSEVLGLNGMVATSQPLASEAGLQILKDGGNAVDAAVAAAAVLNVVEAVSAGIGGDMFAIVWLAKEKKLIALNGSGAAPTGATPQRYAKLGLTHVPISGVHSISVPGAVDGWDVLLKRAGTKSFKEVLAPAVRIAEEGFGVTERIRADWVGGVKALSADPDAAAVYLRQGQAPATYSIFRNPDLGHALRVLQRDGRDAFYKGEIAAAIVAKMQALGGTMTREDLANTAATWETPITTRYHGYDVYEMPPNTQGFAVLEALNILEVCAPKFGIDLAALGPRSAAYWHMLVEAKKLAYTDLYAFNGDPRFVSVPVERLISKAYAAEQCRKIDPKKASTPEALGDPVGGTVYLATADRWGNMVSFIYSVYDYFGSGIGVPGYGFVLADRAALFSLQPGSPNIIAPHKRPFHTLIPGFLMKDGQPLAAFGLMGGGQQAQGHLQVLVDMIDLGANPQAASDAARFTHAQPSNRLALESQLFDLVGAQLKAMGHQVASRGDADMGGYQAIWRDPKTGMLRGASDHRKDGGAMGW